MELGVVKVSGISGKEREKLAGEILDFIMVMAAEKFEFIRILELSGGGASS